MIFLSTYVNNERMQLLIDTGATMTFINEHALRRLSPLPTIHRQYRSFLLADGVVPFTTSGLVNLSIQFSTTFTTIQAHVVPQLCSDIIIGMDYINRYNLNINIKRQVVSIDHHHQQWSMPIHPHQSSLTNSAIFPHFLRLPPHSTRTISLKLSNYNHSSIFIPDVDFERNTSLIVTHPLIMSHGHSTLLTIINTTNTSQLIPRNSHLGYFLPRVKSRPWSPTPSFVSGAYDVPSFTGRISVIQAPQIEESPCPVPPIVSIHSESMKPALQEALHRLTKDISHSSQREQLLDVLSSFRTVFDTTKHNIANTPINHVIPTVPHHPPACRPYPQPNTEEALYKIVQEFLAAGLVSESSSPYASPAMLVKKSDGSHRLVVNYKNLNSITVKDSSPLPNIEEVLRKLGLGYNYFSKLDLKSGFYQIPINPMDKPKTAFITPFGLYQFNVLPMGLKNSPPTFQKVMMNTLKSCRSFSLVYLDDIIIFSLSFDEHIQHLTYVLTALQAKSIILNPSKCTLAVPQIDYLGHLICKHRLQPSEEKISAILKIAEPRTLTQANNFLGALGWYRKFIPNFATIAAPIHAITNLVKAHRHKFRWTSVHTAAFNQLKQLLISTPLFLHYPVPDTPLILTTDASNFGIGGVLQQQVNGELRNLYYHSQLLSSCQRRYSTIEKEAFALLKCFERMRPYLLNKPIIIMTDHCPLCGIMTKSIKNTRVDRISILIQEYDIIQVLHIKGKENCLPDFLSRYPPIDHDELFDTDYGLESKTTESLLPHSITNTSATQSSSISSMILRSGKQISSSSSPSIVIDPQLPISPPINNEIDMSENTDQQSPDTSFSSNFFDQSLIESEQHKDPHIQQAIQTCHQHSTRTSFIVRQNLLYKLIQPVAQSRTKIAVIYLPASLVTSLLSASHNDPLTGAHFSTDRTYYKLKRHYWWPSMKYSIHKFIGSCISCQQYNIDRHKKPGHLKPITPPSAPFQFIGIDYCGPFRVTPQGNQYVLVITDFFSRHVTAIALPNCTAETTAITLFNHFFCQFGIPSAILSDQGSHFQNHLMANIRRLIGYNHIYSTAYHPQTNGIVERFNGTFVPQISKLQDIAHNNWDEYLSAVVFAYNSGVHRTTKYSPYELLYGCTPRLPIYPSPTDFYFPKPSDYFQQLQKTLKLYHSMARQNILHQQQLNKVRYDTRRTDPCYQIGDLVLTRIHGLKNKLDPRYSLQPKTIIDTFHPTYIVHDPSTQHEFRVHVSDLRPIYKP